MLGNRGEMIVNRLCEILNANLSHLESPTVRILGNLATATDEITDLVMKTDGIKYICKMLAHDIDEELLEMFIESLMVA